MSRRLRDGMSLNPRIPWLGIAVAVVLAAVIAAIFVFISIEAHGNALVQDLTGEWVRPSGAAATRLSIGPETRRVGFSSELTHDAGGLLVTGSIEGRPVSGRIVVPKLPPWGSTVHVTLLGRGWTLRSQHSPRRLTLISDTGSEVTLSPAQ